MAANDTPENKFLPTRRSLLSRLRNLDDQVSWQDFFETYWKLIYSAATKSGLSDADAQDVVQETVLTVTRTIGEFRYNAKAGSFKGWLLNTTRWRILDHLRRRKPDQQPHRTTDPAGADGIGQLPDPTSERIEQIWEREWQQNLLDAAMQRIKRQTKPKHFQAFELNALKGWEATKVSEALGLNLAQVHLIKHRVGNLVKLEVKRLQEQGV